MSSFQAHGSLDVKVEGRLLIIEGAGPWNAESLNESGSSAKALVENLYGKPWGVIATIHGEPIYVPEAAEQLTNIVKQEKHKGRVASALLVEESESPRFAKNHIGEIYRQAGENFAFFTDMDEARSWVLDKIEQASIV